MNKDLRCRKKGREGWSKQTWRQGGRVRERKGKRWKEEGRKELEEEKMIGRESRTCNEKGLMNGGRDKRKKRGKKQVKEKRGKKLGKEGGKKRETGQEVKERERERELCRILPKPRVRKLVPFSWHQHTDNRVLDSLLSTTPRRKTGALACLFY